MRIEARKEAADKLINGIRPKDDKELEKGLKEYEKGSDKVWECRTHRFKNNCKAGSKESNKDKDTTSHISKAREKD